MCFSAEVYADYHRFVAEFGAVLNLRQFADLFYERTKDGGWRRIAKAMKDAFRCSATATEREIEAATIEGDAKEAQKLEQELFAQKKRLADAERTLKTKTTMKALNDQRVATNKIEQAQRQLDDLKRKQPKDRDSRIFPGMFAPVMIVQDGARTLVPMRYQCRLPGWNAVTERKYPGTYNARRDNLEGAWKQLFGRHHGIMIVTTFYENVAKHKAEGRELKPGEKEENLVLQFNPDPPHAMLVACLWNVAKGAEPEGGDLYSFAAITDEPPAEVAAAGHDRCIVPIKREYIDAWLNPDPNDLAALYAILDDRDRPYYEHRLAA